MEAREIKTGITIRNKSMKYARHWKVVKKYTGMFLIKRYDGKVAVIMPGQYRLFERVK